LFNTVDDFDLSNTNIGFKALTGKGANIDINNP
jgi:hypothetical protein